MPLRRRTADGKQPTGNSRLEKPTGNTHVFTRKCSSALQPQARRQYVGQLAPRPNIYEQLRIAATPKELSERSDVVRLRRSSELLVDEQAAPFVAGQLALARTARARIEQLRRRFAQLRLRVSDGLLERRVVGQATWLGCV